MCENIAFLFLYQFHQAQMFICAHKDSIPSLVVAHNSGFGNVLNVSVAAHRLLAHLRLME